MSELVRPRRRTGRQSVTIDVDGPGPAVPAELLASVWDVGLTPMLIARVSDRPGVPRRLSGTVAATLDQRHIAFARALVTPDGPWSSREPDLVLLDGEVAARTGPPSQVRWQAERCAVVRGATWRGRALRDGDGRMLVRAGAGRTRVASAADPAALTLAMVLLAHGALGRRGVAGAEHGGRRVLRRTGGKTAEVAGDVAAEAALHGAVDVVVDGVGDLLGALVGGIFDGL